MSFNHPLFQSLVLPAVVAFVMAGVLRATGGQTLGPRLAPTAAALGLLAAGWQIVGFGAMPPGSATEKLPWLFAALLLIAAAAAVGDVSRRAGLLIATLAAIAGASWLAAPLLQGMTSARLLASAAACVACAGALLLAYRSNERQADQPALLGCAAAGLGGVAFQAGSLLLFQLAIALAAALVGVALWNWPRPRDRFGAAALLAGAPAFGLIAIALGLLTEVRALALLALAAIALLAPWADRWPMPARWSRSTAQPVVLALAAGALALLAVLLAEPGAGSGADPYLR